MKNKLDISGRPMEVTDAKERIMTWHFYGFTQALTTRNIDSGKRWTINDVAGKPIRAWDERGHAFRNTYDVLQRPLEMFVTENSIEKLVQKQEYGISSVLNNIGQVENIYTQDGKTNIQAYDFKNNVLSLKKQFVVDYTNVLDWSQTVNLQTEEFITQTSYDALNRPITITQPDNTVVSHVYNKGGLLEQVLHGTVTYISNINYNEKGQREDVYYGNNTKTRYYYDAKTFRLKRLLTTRNNGTDILQDINYTFDAVGNIVQQKDNALQTFYFDNQVIAPNLTYIYDPLYRLINATGRELSSLASPTNEDFANNIGVPNPAANAMQNYNHTYVFDELGNMQSDNWKDYVYDTVTNRLLKHDPDQTLDDYTYDNHGNMLTMPHLTSMVWDYADRLQSAGNGTFTSYYNYDMGGNRSRKVVIKNNIKEERYYVGDYEIYRKFVNDVLDTERSTIHIMDDRDRFAMIETETGNTPVVRYQYNNHLGSACLELDSSAAIISYEEYHPYGTTSYRSGRSETEASLKRYKYVGKERDEETGLYYYGARYYAAWICRFVSVDALQFKYPDLTPFQYASNGPVAFIDLDGLEKANKNEQKNRFEFSLPVTPSDQINSQIPKIQIPKNLHVQKYPQLIDQSKIKNQNAVIRRQDVTTTYYDEKNYQQRQSNYYKSQYFKKLQATNNFFYGNPGQPVGSSGALGSVKAGYEAWSLVEGGYGLIKLTQFASKLAFVKFGFTSNVAKTGESVYDGVRSASKYLQEQGVPRVYRKQIIESFEIKTISMRTADNATFGLRFYGGNAAQSGRNLFPTFTNYTNRAGLALPSDWNSMTGIMQFQIAPRSTYIFGRTASQGGVFSGGSYQMYVNNLNNLIKIR